MSEQIKEEIKIKFLGGASVGKTSIIKKFCSDIFYEDESSIMEYSALTKQMEFNGKKININCIDTTSKENFLNYNMDIFQIKNAIKESSGIILVYSPDKEDSFNSISSFWFKTILSEALTGKKEEKIEKNLQPEKEPIIAIVMNKNDLKTGDMYGQKSLGENFAKANKTLFFITTAKTGQGINELFYRIVEEIKGEKRKSSCCLCS